MEEGLQQLTAAVLTAFGSALIVMGGYHLFVAGPRFRRALAMLGTHDGLLGGGAATPASRRVELLEALAAQAGSDAASVAARVDALERIARSEVPRVGFVRFNAFQDVGSDQSFALALLTRDGDGVVISSIHSREDTRTYGKSVVKFQVAKDASQEENDAIARARAVMS